MFGKLVFEIKFYFLFLFNVSHRCILIIYAFFAKTTTKMDVFGITNLRIVFKFFLYFFLSGNNEYGNAPYRFIKLWQHGGPKRGLRNGYCRAFKCVESFACSNFNYQFVRDIFSGGLVLWV